MFTWKILQYFREILHLHIQFCGRNACLVHFFIKWFHICHINFSNLTEFYRISGQILTRAAKSSVKRSEDFGK